MQALTTQQGDAILDVVKQCWEVGRLYKEKAQGYKKGVELLVDLSLFAFAIGVTAEVLDGVIAKNLPPVVREVVNSVRENDS